MCVVEKKKNKNFKKKKRNHAIFVSVQCRNILHTCITLIYMTIYFSHTIKTNISRCQVVKVTQNWSIMAAPGRNCLCSMELKRGINSLLQAEKAVLWTIVSKCRYLMNLLWIPSAQS